MAVTAGWPLQNTGLQVERGEAEKLPVSCCSSRSVTGPPSESKLRGSGTRANSICGRASSPFYVQQVALHMMALYTGDVFSTSGILKSERLGRYSHARSTPPASASTWAWPAGAALSASPGSPVRPGFYSPVRASYQRPCVLRPYYASSNLSESALSPAGPAGRLGLGWKQEEGIERKLKREEGGRLVPVCPAAGCSAPFASLQ